jgi:hypothetical protein
MFVQVDLFSVKFTSTPDPQFRVGAFDNGFSTGAHSPRLLSTPPHACKSIQNFHSMAPIPPQAKKSAGGFQQPIVLLFIPVVRIFQSKTNSRRQALAQSSKTRKYQEDTSSSNGREKKRVSMNST